MSISNRDEVLAQILRVWQSVSPHADKSVGVDSDSELGMTESMLSKPAEKAESDLAKSEHAKSTIDPAMPKSDSGATNDASPEKDRSFSVIATG